MTDGLNKELLVRYSDHGLNNTLLVRYSGHGLNNKLTRHLNSEQVKVHYSGVSAIQIFAFQIYTVNLLDIYLYFEKNIG